MQVNDTLASLKIGQFELDAEGLAAIGDALRVARQHLHQPQFMALLAGEPHAHNPRPQRNRHLQLMFGHH